MKKGNNQDIDTYSNIIDFVKRRELNMIKKKSKDFNFDQYVLWIIPDFYAKNNVLTAGDIKVLKRGGEEYNLQFEQRKPYPNKRIHQLSEIPPDKRRHLYGIPLLFDSFEELQTIGKIMINWYVLFPYWEGRKLKFDAEIVHTEYKIDFDRDPVHKIYTMTTKDYILLGDELSPEQKDNYIKEYESIVSYAGGFQSEFQKVWEKNDVYGDDRFPKLDDIVSFAPASFRIHAEARRDTIKSIRYYDMRSHETLKAHEIATILTESSFGFSD